MPRLRPTALTTRVFNPLVRMTTLWDVHTLEVERRKSLAPQRTPVVPVEVDGETHLVSPYGESDWVRNVRAAGRLTLTQRGRTTAYRPVELAVDERAPVIAAWRRKAGWTVRIYWVLRPDPADHPVFRLLRG